MQSFNGVRIFSATLARNREELGETVTNWLKSHPTYEVKDMRVVQSSDREFHCVTIVIFYDEQGV